MATTASDQRVLAKRLAERNRIIARFAAQYPGEDQATIEQWADDEVLELDMQEWAERSERGDQEDSPCLEAFNCDDAGTGEGAYHGRV